MSAPIEEDVTDLLERARAGDVGARDRAVSALYRELSRLAHGKLAAESTITHLDTSALVHECWLRLAQGRSGRWEHRGAFFAYAASVMRSVIVDTVRDRNALKRGGGKGEVTLTTGLAEEVFAEDELERLEVALQALGKADAALLSLVEMRYFAGMTVEEIARHLELAPATVKRRWTMARAFLYREMTA